MYFKPIRKIQLVITLLSGMLLLLIQCTEQDAAQLKPNAPEPPKFAGSKSCAGCHADIYNKHLLSAHYLTSQKAGPDNIKGSSPWKNESYFYNASVSVKVEKRESGYYQAEYFKEVEKKAFPMDIVLGSGAKGRSYLHWNNQHLLQLPLTYFSAAGQWANSPGFPDKVIFNRVITSRCLECHSTYVKITSTPDKEPESFDKNSIVFGVDCEKCHGPAVEHVAYQSQYPSDSVGRYITNTGKLGRQLQLDLCASCHGGRIQKIKPSFSFIPGDTLSKYFVSDTAAPDPSKIDVHGNQYGLMRASNCFTKTDILTCNSCHDPHENERGKNVFSSKCLGCHETGKQITCKLTHQMGNAINTHCTDCHMPLQASKAIAVFLPNNPFPTSAMIRSHFISIYPEETKKTMQLLKKLQTEKKAVADK